MKHIKSWEYGDLVELDSFNGNTDYNSIELPNDNDEVSKNTFSRPLRNIYNIVNNLDFINNKISLMNGLEEGVLLNDFEIDPATDIKTVLVKDSDDNIIRKHFIRVSPGVVYLNGNNIPHFPSISIAERQLSDILELDKINIEYTPDTDKFKIQIQKDNSTFNYYIGDTYGDSFSGYNTGIEALLSIYGDSINFPEFKEFINENIENIVLEENIILSGGDSLFIGLNDKGYLIGDTHNVYFPLYHIKTSLVSNEIRVNSFSDLRKSSQGGTINNELITEGNFSNGVFPSLNNNGVVYIEGNGSRSITNSESYGNIIGDTLSGLFTSTGGTLYFSGEEQSIYSFSPDDIYKFSIRIKLNNNTNHNNVSFNLYEYSSSGTLITSSPARNIDDWQELIIIKRINSNTDSLTIGINVNGNVSIDNLSVKKLTSEAGSKFISIRNISGILYQLM